MDTTDVIADRLVRKRRRVLVSCTRLWYGCRAGPVRMHWVEMEVGRERRLFSSG